MCYRGSRVGADGREFAGFESVEGGVRGIFVVRQLLAFSFLFLIVSLAEASVILTDVRIFRTITC
jgi:hypothetical protein